MADPASVELVAQPTPDGRPGATIHTIREVLKAQLDDPDVVAVDIAAAWVRLAFFDDLEDPLKSLLDRGGSLRIVVGLDLFNTTKEGLVRLLQLVESSQKAGAFVYHNKDRKNTFHPKLYIFRRNSASTTVVIGSPNMTHAAIATNSEVVTIVRVAPGASYTNEALAVVDGWCDTHTGLTRELSAELIEDLVAGRLLLDEQRVSKRIQRLSKLVAGAEHDPRFGNWSVPDTRAGGGRRGRDGGAAGLSGEAPEPEGGGGVSGGGTRGATAQAGGGAVPPVTHVVDQHEPPATARLLLRPLTSRGGTQGQLPVPVWESKWFRGATQMVSAQTGAVKEVSPVHATRNPARPNTVKVELAEAADLTDPVMRLEWDDDTLYYSIFDGPSVQGQAIWEALNDGLEMDPPQTIRGRSTAGRTTLRRFL